MTPEKLNRSSGSSDAALLHGYVMRIRGEYCNKNVNSNEKPAKMATEKRKEKNRYMPGDRACVRLYTCGVSVF